MTYIKKASRHHSWAYKIHDLEKKRSRTHHEREKWMEA